MHDGNHVIEKVRCSPAATSNSSTCLPSKAVGSLVPRRTSMSGPATALM